MELNRENTFHDITTKDMKPEYPKTQMMGQHEFYYIENGIYGAVNPFEVKSEELQEMLQGYDELTTVLCGLADDPEKDLRVLFGFRSFNTGFTFDKENYAWNKIGHDDPEFSPYKKYLRDGFFHSIKAEHAAENADPLFAPFYHNIGSLEDPKPMIEVNGEIGYEAEPGIWYFPKDRAVMYADRKAIGAEAAVLADNWKYELSDDGRLLVRYLAIGRESFERLKEINRKRWLHFYILGEEGDEPAKGENEAESNTAGGTKENLVIPEDAKELVEGIGFYDLDISARNPFLSGLMDERKIDGKYAAAYIQDDMLVLIRFPQEGPMHMEKHKLSLLSELSVSVNHKLDCGISYPYTYSVIDCYEEKLKELLTPEAYEAYMYEHKTFWH